MRRQKSVLLLGTVAGGLLLAEAGALVLAAQVDLSGADPWMVGLSVVAVLLWTFLLATGLVNVVRHVMLGGMLDASTRLEAARSSAHVGLLGITPTIGLLAKAVDRQEQHLTELRDTLLASALGGGKSRTDGSDHQVARAAGLAAGVLHSNGELRRLALTLENWVVAARARQETLRERVAALKESVEMLPPAAVAKAEAPDPVFGYAATPLGEVEADPWAGLPEALKRRLRGTEHWSGAAEEDTERN